VGALIALPLAAIARETTMYLRRHLVLEPWGTPSAAALRDELPAVEARPARRRCPECGTSATPSAEFCFACGTPLRPQLGSPDGDGSSERPSRRRSTLLPAWSAGRPRWPGSRRRSSQRTTTPPERAPAEGARAADSADTPRVP
jgi:hypothetical protein